MKRTLLTAPFYLLPFPASKRETVLSRPRNTDYLQEESKSEISFSKGRAIEDLVESHYAGLLGKTPELNELGKTFRNLQEQKQDSLYTFEKFDEKNMSYYNSARVI